MFITKTGTSPFCHAANIIQMFSLLYTNNVKISIWHNDKLCWYCFLMQCLCSNRLWWSFCIKQPWMLWDLWDRKTISYKVCCDNTKGEAHKSFSSCALAWKFVFMKGHQFFKSWMAAFRTSATVLSVILRFVCSICFAHISRSASDSSGAVFLTFSYKETAI